MSVDVQQLRSFEDVFKTPGLCCTVLHDGYILLLMFSIVVLSTAVIQLT